MVIIHKTAYLAVILMVVCSTMVHSETDKPAAGNFCQGCKSTVSFLHRLNGTSTRGQFKHALMQFCLNNYPSATDYRNGPCDYMVAKTMQTLDRMNPVTHCDEIGACGPIEDEMSLAILGIERPKDDVVCNICVDTVNQFKESLSDPKNIAQIRAGFEQLCQYLKGIHEDQACQDLFNNYVDQMLQFIQRVDAKTYCKALSLCPKQTVGLLNSLSDIIRPPTWDELTGFGLQMSSSLMGPVAQQEVVTTPKPTQVERAVDDALPCTLCKTVIKQILPLINANRTEASIEAALRSVCNLIYKEDAKIKECDEFVDKYADEIVKILVDESAPELVCMMIELCTYNVPIKTFSPVDENQSALHSELYTFKSIFTQMDVLLNKSREECFECKMFVHFVKTKLSSTKSLEEFKNLLITKICARIPDSNIASNCKIMVERYAGKFYDAIIHQMNEEEVCEQLNMCKPKKDLESFVMTSKDNYCDTCTSTVAYIDKLLATQSVDKEISHLVDTICEKFPDTNRNECRLIIDTFGPEILRAIGTMNNPNQLCCDIGLCHKDPKKHLLGAGKCSFGPSYWCKSTNHASACNAYDYCNRKVWKSNP